MLLAHAVDEELDVSTPRAREHVELFTLDEDLANLAEQAPVGAFMKAPAPEVLEPPIAAEAVQCDGAVFGPWRIIAQPGAPSSQHRILVLDIGRHPERSRPFEQLDDPIGNARFR